jgi:hypothetical protein
MDNNQQPNAELELGVEPNSSMTTQEANSDASQASNLADFFMRALSDGQTKAVPDSTETNESENAYNGEEEEVETGELYSSDETASEEPEMANESEAENEAETHEEHVPRGVDKRISKLTALRREAEERAKKLEEELESLKRSQAEPRSPNPYKNLDSEDKITAEYEKFRKVRLFCERYPDGYYEGDPQHHMSREEIAKAKVESLRALEEYLPEQAQYVTAKREYKVKAKQEFPWLDDPTDKRANIAKKFIEAVPQIKQFPDYEIYAAQLALGMSMYQKQKQNARQGIQPTAPVQPRAMSSAPRPTPRRDQVEAQRSSENFRRTGTIDALADVFKSKFV